jgi:hypothetical protein
MTRETVIMETLALFATSEIVTNRIASSLSGWFNHHIEAGPVCQARIRAALDICATAWYAFCKKIEKRESLMRKALKPLWSLVVALMLSLLLISGAAATTLSGENKGVLPLNGTPYSIDNITVANSYVTFHLDTAVKFSMLCSVPSTNGIIVLHVYKGTPEDCEGLVNSGTNYTTAGGRKIADLEPIYLTKGDYAVTMQRSSPLASSCILTAAVSPLPSDDSGDNDTADSATAIAFPGGADGIVESSGDVDCYKFTLAQAGPVELSVRNKLAENTMRLDVLSGGTTVYSTAMKASASSQLYVRRLYLDAGSYVVSLQLDGDNKYRGFAYNLSVRRGDPIENLWMPASGTFTVGVPTQLYIDMSDAYLNCGQFKWVSSNSSVATVDDGVVTGVAPGSCTISATSADGNYSLQCKATVKDNVFTRNKPYVGKAKGLYSSAKKMYYQGDRLYVEVFVYNKLGGTTPKLYEWAALAYYLKGWDEDEDGNAIPILGCAAYEFVDVPSIRKNSYTVVKFSQDMTGKTRMDLRSGAFDACICDDDTFQEEFGGDVSWKGLPSRRATRKPSAWKLYNAPVKGGK